MAAQAANTTRLDFDEIHIPPGPRLGNLVIEVERLSKALGDRELFSDLSFSLPRNGITGVIGPNGVGKTTLFQMLTGSEEPDAGNIRVGETVRVAYVDQARTHIDPNRTAWEVVSGGDDVMQIGPVQVPSRASSPHSASRDPISKSLRACSLAGNVIDSTWRLPQTRRQRAAAGRADQ